VPTLTRVKATKLAGGSTVARTRAVPAGALAATQTGLFLLSSWLRYTVVGTGVVLFL
jgi:hypothetical protein